MFRRQTLLFILMLLLSGASLSALTPGIRLTTGLSSGVGEGWNEILDDAGNRDFDDAMLCFGLAGFLDIPLEENYLFIPELGIAFNRGARLSNRDGDSVEISTPVVLELILPVGRDLELGGGKRAVRVFGGFQVQYALGLEIRTDVDGHSETIDPDNHTPFAAGIVLGTGLEFGRLRKRPWFLDLRLKIPFSDTISYDSADEGRYQISDMQISLGGGLKFR